MLRTNRVYGVDGELSKGYRFAQAFQGDLWPERVDPGKVSRWERCLARVDYTVIRRYEELLQLPRHHLVALADWAARDALGHAGPPVLARPNSSADLLGDLVDRVVSGDRLDAGAWDDLTVDFDAVREVLPKGDPRWYRIAERLVSELSIAEGPAWLRRNEALTRLIGDQENAVVVVAACAAFAGDPANHMSADPLNVLDVSPHPDAARQLMKLLRAPASESARRGAWWAMAQKVRRPHLSPPNRIELARLAGDLLSGADGHPASRPQAAEILRLLGAGSPAAIKRFGGNEATRRILSTGSAADPDLVAPYIAVLSDGIRSRMPRDGLIDDLILDHLLFEILFETRIDVQIAALYRIMATPYREPVAETLAAELDRTATMADTDLVLAIINALAALGDAIHRRRLERLAVDRRVAPVITDACVWKLAHCAGTSSDAFWQALIDRYIPDDGNFLAEHAARGVVYGLGVHRRFTELRRVHRNPSLPSQVRSSASWWLNVGTEILRSTERHELNATGYP